jgi:membrane protein YdbS with pleckstrin-like domain
MLVYALYVAGYHTYVDEAVNPVEVLLAMLLKPYFLMPVFAIMVLCVFFFSLLFVILSLLLGAFFLFAVEVTIFIQMLLFKKASRGLEEDEFEYLLQKRSK